MKVNNIHWARIPEFSGKWCELCSCSRSQLYLIIMNIQFRIHDMYSHNQLYFSHGGFDCYKWNLCSHSHVLIPKMVKLLCNVKNFSFIHRFYSSKVWGLSNEIFVGILPIVYICVSYLPTTSLYLCPIHWRMRFHAENYVLVISFVCCIIFDIVFIFFTVVYAAFYCFTDIHMRSRICCYVVSFIVINSYKITLFPC